MVRSRKPIDSRRTERGGAVPLWGGDMAELTKPVAQGGSFWVFKLPSWANE